VDARKTRFREAEALKLAKSASRVVAARGRAVVAFDMSKRPRDAELLSAILGPTGNLRAPALRVGETLLVGFNEEAYRQAGL